MMDKSAVLAMQEGQALAIEKLAASVDLALDDHRGLLYVPDGFKREDIESVLTYRRRARGTMTTQNPEAFAKYVAAHSEPGASVFVDANHMTAAAVLNLGSPGAPGHCDNRAVLELEHTAAYKALLSTVGSPRQQQAIVEFFEDWMDYCKFMSEEYVSLDPRYAIAALRHLTIETARKAESKVGNLSAEASAFERVKAESPDMIPVFIEFTTVPYLHLQSHTFKLRLAIHTPNDKAPQIGLQIRNLEEKKQEMAEEFVELARSSLSLEAPQLPVMVGSYARAS